MTTKDYIKENPDKRTEVIFTLLDGTPIQAQFLSITEQDYQQKKALA